MIDIIIRIIAILVSNVVWYYIGRVEGKRVGKKFEGI